MRHILRRLLKEYEEEKAFTKNEVLFFKFLNTYKKASKATKPELSKFILNNMSSFGFDPAEFTHYINLYTQNYREDGRYDLTKKSEINQYHTLKKQKTSNANARDFVVELKPFKGSNLRADWEQDHNGEWAYIVYSWDWYPIFMYKYKRWFEVDDRYSSSTGKHMSNATPRRYNEKLGKTMYIVSRKDMRDLRDGNQTVESVTKNKNKMFTDKIEKQIDNLQQVRLGWDPRVRIVFNFESVTIEDDSPVIDLEVVKIDKMGGQTYTQIDREAGNFFRDEMVGVTKEYVTDLLKDYITDYSSNILGRDVSKNILVNISYLDN
jgi:hypothetical protein